MRNLLHRLKARVLSIGDWFIGEVGSDEQAWQRRSEKAERTFELTAIRELSPVEAKQADMLLSHVEQIKAATEPRYDYLEPIGPKRVEELTVDERWQLFESDPLGAVLPGQPAKDNPHFADVHSSMELSKPVAEDLELTRGWEIGQLARFAQMAGKAER